MVLRHSSSKESIMGIEVLRIVSFYPAVNSGKYHAARKITGVAACKGNILCNLGAGPIVANVGDTRIHPIVCSKCVQFAIDPNLTNVGLV